METKTKRETAYRETNKLVWFFKLYDGLDEACKNEVKLNQADKLIYGAFDGYCNLNHTDKNDYSNDVYSIITKTNRNQPSKSFKKLEEAGLVEIEQNGNKRTIKKVKKFSKDSTFVKIYTSVMDYEGLTISEKIVYSVIHTLSEGIVVDGENVCKGSNDLIAKRANCTKRTVITAIQKLEDLGLIEVSYDDSNRKRDIKIAIDLWDAETGTKFMLGNNDSYERLSEIDKKDFDCFMINWEKVEAFYAWQFSNGEGGVA